jgi:osmotically-inducible protein OsmY
MRKPALACVLATLTSFGSYAFAAETSSEVVNANSNTAEQQSTMDDQSIKFKLSNQLNDMYPNNNIEVTVFNNQALLTGQVKTVDVKKSAQGYAQKFNGIKGVANYLTVGVKQSAAQTSKDSWITTKATTKLATVAGVNTSEIKLVTTQGIIYVMGNVTPEQLTAIKNNLRTISGVRKIVPVVALKK